MFFQLVWRLSEFVFFVRLTSVAALLFFGGKMMKRKLFSIALLVAALIILGSCQWFDPGVSNHTHITAETVIENRIEPTADKDGSYDEVAYCVQCGEEIRRVQFSIPKCSHTNVTILDEIVATCKNTGLTNGVKCLDCDVVLLEQEIVAKANHVEQEIPEVDATCIREGKTKGTVCAVCEEILVDQKIIELTRHLYLDYSCTVCGARPDGSEGLEYELLENDTYAVSSVGSCEESYVTIPPTYGGKPVTEIKELAFEGCVTIEHLELHDSLNTIATNAFVGCVNLKSVNIPASVEKIVTGAFEGCTNMEKLYIDDLVEWCSIDFEGARYLSSCVNPLHYAKEIFIDNVRTYDLVIPDGIKRVSPVAFAGFGSISSVTVPDSIVEFGDAAFENCPKLKRVKISDLNHWYEISFGGSSGGTGIESANPLANGAKLYLNGEKIEKIVIPSYLSEVPCEVFNGCSSIKNVVIHSDVEVIRENAFQFCENLVSVSFEEGSCLKEIGTCAFEGCEKLEYINLPNTVSTIYQWAFSGCWLLNFDLPKGLTHIGYDPFPHQMRETVDGCEYVGNWLINGYYGNSDHVIIREGTVGIAENGFKDYYSKPFKSVTIPESLKYICDIAFEGHEELELVIFKGESSLTKIDGSAFSNCSSIKSITLPKNLESIGNYVFEGCTSLESVIWNTNNDFYCYRNYDEYGDIIFYHDELCDAKLLAEYLTSDFCECRWVKK